ncbi:MAG: hypothetical protein DHS20C18_45730 [Saprospiraceae bacterium]|nr:MAG: hypothetical protein DHS20C18_45730 [Saprospiraceae bacterium]
MTNYQELLNIQLLHEYYTDGKFSQVNIQPDTATQQWMKQLGIRFLQQDNVARLVAPDSINLQEISSETPALQLRFECVANDPLFVNFTDIPIDSPGTLTYSKDAKEESNVNAPIALLGEFEPSGGQVQISAAINIALADLKQAQATLPIVYTVPFKARSTSWRYYVISQDEHLLLQLKNQQGELWNAPTSTMLPDGSKAQLFDSGAVLFPFQENSPVHLSLFDSAKKMVLIDRLPNASPQSLQYPKPNDGTQEVYSQVYVYL